MSQTRSSPTHDVKQLLKDYLVPVLLPFGLVLVVFLGVFAFFGGVVVVPGVIMVAVARLYPILLTLLALLAAWGLLLAASVGKIRVFYFDLAMSIASTIYACIYLFADPSPPPTRLILTAVGLLLGALVSWQLLTSESIVHSPELATLDSRLITDAEGVTHRLCIIPPLTSLNPAAISTPVKVLVVLPALLILVAGVLNFFSILFGLAGLLNWGRSLLALAWGVLAVMGWWGSIHWLSVEAEKDIKVFWQPLEAQTVARFTLYKTIAEVFRRLSERIATSLIRWG